MPDQNWWKRFRLLIHTLPLLLLLILVGSDSHNSHPHMMAFLRDTVSSSSTNNNSRSRSEITSGTAPPLPHYSSTTTVKDLVHGSREVREIPEAMLDPYSVLGVLSFGVYIFYILYTRYRMRGHHPPSPSAQQPQQQGGPALFSIDAQENFANILKMATNIISNAPYLGLTNGTLDSDDYFDDGEGLRSHQKPNRRRK